MLENIGSKIKEAREEQGISQKDLGMALGLSDKAISAYEASRTVPPLETLIRVADELNKPIDYFISSNAADYKLETRLAAMESVVQHLLKEIQKIQEFLEVNKKEEEKKDSDKSLPENKIPIMEPDQPHDNSNLDKEVSS